MFLNRDSSRIDGFFGPLKANYGHDRGQITTTQSYASHNSTTNLYSAFPLIPKDQVKNYGKIILKYLSDEYKNKLTFIQMNEPCVWCELTIPCRHTIQLGYIININSISKKFLRVTNDPQNLPNQVIISDDTVPVQKTRSSFLARIDPYFNLYGKIHMLTRF